MAFCWYITGLAPSTEIAWVAGTLIFTIYLFVFEIVSVDETAITIMVLLGLSSLWAPAMGLEHGLVETQHLFDGFASNAVMSIIAVMIIGAGLDKTGMMSKVAAFILRWAEVPRTASFQSCRVRSALFPRSCKISAPPPCSCR